VEGVEGQQLPRRERMSPAPVHRPGVCRTAPSEELKAGPPWCALVGRRSLGSGSVRAHFLPRQLRDSDSLWSSVDGSSRLPEPIWSSLHVTLKGVLFVLRARREPAASTCQQYGSFRIGLQVVEVVWGGAISTTSLCGAVAPTAAERSRSSPSLVESRLMLASCRQWPRRWHWRSPGFAWPLAATPFKVRCM
jgi:hypothetical protein